MAIHKHAGLTLRRREDLVQHWARAAAKLAASQSPPRPPGLLDQFAATADAAAALSLLSGKPCTSPSTITPPRLVP
jgi:hypothetical protein